MGKDYNKECAALMEKAIKGFSEHPENLDNFIYYLERHFTVWLEKYANTPADLAGELADFATMDI